YGSQYYVLDAWLRRGSDRNRIAVATQSRSDPNYVHVLNRRWPLRATTIRGNFCRHRFSLLSLVGQTFLSVFHSFLSLSLAFPSRTDIPVCPSLFLSHAPRDRQECLSYYKS